MQRILTFLVLAGAAVYCFCLSLQYLRRRGSLWNSVLTHDSDRISRRYEFLSNFRHPGMASAYLSAACALLSLSAFYRHHSDFFLHAATGVTLLIAFSLGVTAPDYGMTAEPAAPRQPTGI